MKKRSHFSSGASQDLSVEMNENVRKIGIWHFEVDLYILSCWANVTE